MMLCKMFLVLHIQDIQERYRRLESRYNEAEDNRSSLEHDLHALVTVISVARRTGKWQLEGLRLRQVDYNRVFGESTPLKYVIPNRIWNIRCEIILTLS